MWGLQILSCSDLSYEYNKHKTGLWYFLRISLFRLYEINWDWETCMTSEKISLMVFAGPILLPLDLYTPHILWEACSLFFCVSSLFVKLMDNKVWWGSFTWRSDPDALVCTHCKAKQNMVHDWKKMYKSCSFLHVV